jgi:hypothetical protein
MRARFVLLLVVCGGYPHFEHQTKTSSGMFKQKYHLIGALVHGRGAWVYTMSHRFPADPNVTIEVLQRVLADLSEESGGPLPKKLYLQLDNCVRENKNRAVMAYLCWLVQRRIFKEIHVSFLPVGHTHEDIDQVWSRTSIQMKGHNVCCEEELFALIQDSFHHYGHKARCGSLETVANVKEWILPHCEEMAGLAGREIQHLKIVAHEDGPAIFTKHAANGGIDEGWSEKGHVYQTPSCGFHLLHKNTPAPPFVDAAEARPLPLKPKEQNARVLDRLETALKLCGSDLRVSKAAWQSLERSLLTLRDTNPVPFSWPYDGQLLCERMHAYDAARYAALQAVRQAPVDADVAHRQLVLEHEADREYDRLMEEEEKQAARDDEDTEGEQEDPRPKVPIGLRTAPQEQQRLKDKAEAEQENKFFVSALAPLHFVIFEPSSEQREGGGGGPKKGRKVAADTRQFWVGQVWEEEQWVDEVTGKTEYAINRTTGEIALHNYTPYNVKKGAAASNRIAKEWGDYTPEYNAAKKALWTTCLWSQVLYVVSHLIPHEGNPDTIGPDSRSYFKLPNFLKTGLRAIFDGKVTRPRRFPTDPVLVAGAHGASAAQKRAAIPASGRSPKFRRASHSSVDASSEDQEDDEKEEEEYQAPRRTTRARRK